MAEELMTIREAANFLSVSEPRVRRFIRTGTLASYKTPAHKTRLMLLRSDLVTLREELMEPVRIYSKNQVIRP